MVRLILGSRTRADILAGSRSTKLEGVHFSRRIQVPLKKCRSDSAGTVPPGTSVSVDLSPCLTQKQFKDHSTSSIHRIFDILEKFNMTDAGSS